MANVKISALPAATTVASADVLPIVQSATTKKATFQVLSDALGVTSTVAGSSAGMVFITQATLTSAANGFINNCFSSAYQNYRIVINGVGSNATPAGAVIQLRKSGTNSATGYYYSVIYSTQVAGPTRGFNANVTSGEIGAFGDIGQQSSIIDISSPFENVKTTWKDSCNGWATNGGYYAEHYHLHNVADTYDGFYFAMSSGTFTGKIYVYGYRNS